MTPLKGWLLMTDHRRSTSNLGLEVDRSHAGNAPYSHRYLTVVPLQSLQRYDGEVTVE